MRMPELYKHHYDDTEEVDVEQDDGSDDGFPDNDDTTTTSVNSEATTCGAGGDMKRRYPRERTTFTASQLKYLEELFRLKKYLSLIERSKVKHLSTLSVKKKSAKSD